MADSQTSSSGVAEKVQGNFVVISWNVLHMVHEFNHVYDNSPVIARYSIKEQGSNERMRLGDMINTLRGLLVENSANECFHLFARSTWRFVANAA